MKHIIKPFKNDFTDILFDMVKSTVKQMYGTLYPDNAIDYILSYNTPEHILNDSKEGYTVMCFKDNILTGSGCLLGTNIRRLFVLPEYHRIGIGTAIVNHLEQKAIENNCKSVDLYAMPHSIDFYKKNGYVELELCNYVVDDYNSVDYIKMEKIIDFF